MMEEIVNEIAEAVSRIGVDFLRDNNTDLSDPELVLLQLAIAKSAKEQLMKFYAPDTLTDPDGEVECPRCGHEHFCQEKK